MIVIAEAVVLIGLLGLVVFWAAPLLLRPANEGRTLAAPGAWHVVHYDDGGETRVVLQKVRDGDGHVLDEHVIASVRADDPEYDDKFLAAMNTARQRQALFESEDG